MVGHGGGPERPLGVLTGAGSAGLLKGDDGALGNSGQLGECALAQAPLATERSELCAERAARRQVATVELKAKRGQEHTE